MNRQKVENKKYLKPQFVIPIIALALVWILCTLLFVAGEEWNRIALAKGVAFWVVSLTGYFACRKFRGVYNKWTKGKQLSKKRQEMKVN